MSKKWINHIWGKNISTVDRAATGQCAVASEKRINKTFCILCSVLLSAVLNDWLHGVAEGECLSIWMWCVQTFFFCCRYQQLVYVCGCSEEHLVFWQSATGWGERSGGEDGSFCCSFLHWSWWIEDDASQLSCYSSHCCGCCKLSLHRLTSL